MAETTRRRVLGGAAVAALAAAGARRGRAATPIRLGASLSLTGRFSDSAKYTQEGYLLWAERVNAAGGLNGSPVALTIYDDESNPDTGRVLAQRLIDRDQAIAILGPYSSSITDAEAVVVERAQVPMLASIASDSSIWSRRHLRWSFQAFPSSDYDHEGFLKIVHAKAPALKKLAIIFEQTPFSMAAKEWAAGAAKGMGMTVETYGYTPGAQDFRSIIEHMVGFGAEAVSMGGYYQPSIALTRQMIERGFNPAGYHFIEAANGTTKDALGANAQAVFGRSAWEASSDTPAAHDFVTAYQAKFKRTPSYHSAAAYAAGEALAAAIRAKGTDRAGIRDYLASTKIPTVMGTFAVNARGQQTGYRYTVIQWQNGVSRVVGADLPAPIIWPKPKWS